MATDVVIYNICFLLFFGRDRLLKDNCLAQYFLASRKILNR